MKRLLLVIVLLSLASVVSAQVRPAESGKDDVTNEKNRVMMKEIATKYQGGLFGFSKKEHGTIEFDDINERLVFKSKKTGKERFAVPYSAIRVVYPSTRKVQSGIGRGVGAIPIPGAGIGGTFIKKKKNYLIINYNDQDAEVGGTINFLVDTTEMLLNAVYTVGEKAELKPRGDSYVRGRTF